MSTLIVPKVRRHGRQVSKFQGSGYNSKYSFKLDSALIYGGLEIKTNLVNVDTIDRIWLDINGTTILDVTNSVLDLFDAYLRKHRETGRFVLDFADFDMRDMQGTRVTELVTRAGQDITLNFDVGAQGTGDPVTPDFKLLAYSWDNMRNSPAVFLPMRYTLTPDVASSNRFEWVLPTGNLRRWIQRMAFDMSQVTIDEIQIKRGKNVIHEVTRADVEFAANRYGGKNVQSGWLFLDFVEEGYGLEQALQTQGINFDFRTSGTGALPVHIQGFERVGNIQAARTGA